jgi:putative N6-adenine-specific DNA methylase
MNIIVKTQAGLEDILAEEAAKIGLRDVEPGRRMVSGTGDLKTVYRLNYESRLALKVLVTLEQYTINSAKDLYEKAMNIDWSYWIRPGQTFSIKFTVHSTFFQNSLYAAQLLKDSVVDVIRDKRGSRPTVERKNPDVVIDLHIFEDKVSVSMDSSGEPLFKRNYKNKAFKAPINEILAAGMIMLAKWDGISPLLNPMSGSGTLLWEALFIAENRPPQFFRKKFAFRKWQDYDHNLFTEVVGEANSSIQSPKARIIGVDSNPISMKMFRRNLRELELDEHIHTSVMDFFDYKNNPENGLIIINPPYDERIKIHDVEAFYKRIGDHLKQNFQDNTAWIISANIDGLKSIGLRTSERHTLFNGPLECKYLKYDLFSGSIKEKEQTNP